MLDKKNIKSSIKIVPTSLCVISILLLQACAKAPFYNMPKQQQELCSAYAPNQPVDTTDAFRQGVFDYVVKKGDTLWGISYRFLTKPWLWKKVWYKNPQIKNPNLIYPGDVLTIVKINGANKITISQADSVYHGSSTGKKTSNGLRVYKYRPQVSVSAIDEEPVSIAGSSLTPFLHQTEIYDVDQVNDLPFIIGDKAGYLSLTNEDLVYAASVPSGDEYDIYRVGERFIAPEWNVEEHQGPKYQDPGAIAYEMLLVGQAKLVGWDSSTGLYQLKIEHLIQPLQEKDVLIPINAHGNLPATFFPQPPAANCTQGFMLRNTNQQTQTIKQFDTVVTSFGVEDNARVGDVWKIARKNPPRKINGKVMQMPAKDLGYVMIIKVYEHFSLGFVIASKEIIYDNDPLVRP